MSELHRDLGLCTKGALHDLMQLRAKGRKYAHDTSKKCPMTKEEKEIYHKREIPPNWEWILYKGVVGN